MCAHDEELQVEESEEGWPNIDEAAERGRYEKSSTESFSVQELHQLSKERQWPLDQILQRESARPKRDLDGTRRSARCNSITRVARILKPHTMMNSVQQNWRIQFQSQLQILKMKRYPASRVEKLP